MASTSVYASKRLPVLKSMCTQKGITVTDDLVAEDLVSLLDFSDQREAAEAEKTRLAAAAETEKVRAETEKIRLEAERIRVEAESQKARLDHEYRMSQNTANPRQPETTDKLSKEELKVLSLLKNLEENGDVDQYFDYFEKVSRTNGVPIEKWGYLVAKVITGKALDAYTSLADADLKDYKKVKASILSKYSVGAEHYRKKFRDTRKESDEGYAEFASRLTQNLAKWLEKLGAENDVKKLTQAILLEQFYDCLPGALKVYLLDHKPTDINLAGELAQQYTEHRSSVYGDKAKAESLGSPKTSSNGANKSEKPANSKSPKFSRKENGSTHKNGQTQPNNQNNGRNDKGQNSQERKAYTGCTICGEKDHNWVKCGQKKPLHLSSFSREVGHKSFGKSEFEAQNNDATVQALYDTGATISLEESELVKSHSYTGEKVHIRHAFSPEAITLPIAKVYVESDRFTGEVEAAVYEELPYPFILSPNTQNIFRVTKVNTKAQINKEGNEEKNNPPTSQKKSFEAVNVD